jgi:hypothetical protein
MNSKRLTQQMSGLLLAVNLLTGCSRARVEPTATPTPIPLTLSVRARIDGLSRLLIQGNTVHWYHVAAAAPGRWIPAPTYINGVEWNPDWPDVPDSGNRDCQCSSSSYQGIPAIIEYPPVILEIIQARGKVAIVQQPSQSNDYTLIVEFDDITPPDTYGDEWYEIELKANEIELTATGITGGNTIKLVLLYLGAALTALWGIAHLFPTRSVVKGFGTISVDNQHIITMEWIVEGVSLIFIGILVATVTLIDPAGTISKAVFLLSAIGLFVLASVSLFTGFKVNFLPFKLCPFIFQASALLILVGGLL